MNNGWLKQALDDAGDTAAYQLLSPLTAEERIARLEKQLELGLGTSRNGARAVQRTVTYLIAALKDAGCGVDRRLDILTNTYAKLTRPEQITPPYAEPRKAVILEVLCIWSHTKELGIGDRVVRWLTKLYGNDPFAKEATRLMSAAGFPHFSPKRESLERALLIICDICAKDAREWSRLSELALCLRSSWLKSLEKERFRPFQTLRWLVEATQRLPAEAA